jgi:hypothetical protein
VPANAEDLWATIATVAEEGECDIPIIAAPTAMLVSKSCADHEDMFTDFGVFCGCLNLDF